MVSVSFKDFSMGEGQTWERCEGFGIHDKFKRFVKKVGNALKSNLKYGEMILNSLLLTEGFSARKLE